MKQKATIALFIVTIIWGCTFLWLKRALDSADSVSSAQTNVVSTFFVTLRFGLTLPLFFYFTPSIRKNLGDYRSWYDGFILAFFMLGGFVFQMIGLEGISPAVSAFLTSLYVIFTALILAYLAGRFQSKSLLFGVLLATFGAGYIQGPPELHYDIAEWLTILCAIMFAGHIIFTDIITKRVDPMTVTFTSIAISTLMALLLLNYFMFVNESSINMYTLIIKNDFLVPLLLSSFFGTYVALSLVNYYQKYINPVRAAILYALEPVWATIFAVGTGVTEFNFWLLIGGSCLLVGNLIAEVGNQRESE
ncbi:MAG: DMT family transporter [Candidatus Thermoplasmatota archaeon]|nr:DMT family transporter [Candidatus Thermoplasmatota archaeon]MEC7416016.1 DMT family transporter [Candidatus Thermoplasmatota archaeon]MEC7697260.1 DMT family transporter [Candidatus Thermoplasmatota archaeon]MEC7976371.1 DMT family transporter [Candidatus Thermoplasmatota archaeon]MEC9138925.1 DMT family transporter [Candidatus Thermoplasmatota archaeon]